MRRSAAAALVLVESGTAELSGDVLTVRVMTPVSRNSCGGETPSIMPGSEFTFTGRRVDGPVGPDRTTGAPQGTA